MVLGSTAVSSVRVPIEPCTRPRVLVVDDDANLLEILERFLEEEYDVTIESDPLHALARLRNGERFDVHLYDFCMSNLTGIELLMLTLVAPSGSGPVVMMTGHPSNQTKSEALDSGADAVLDKPLDLEGLREKLRSLRERASMEDAEDPLEAVHRTLVRAVEAKDHTTSGHAVRVREICRIVADHFELDDTDRKVLLQAALVHDVGKIGVPDSILQKPGPLTPEERCKIQEHPHVGYKILEPLPGMSAVKRCVLEHHERWDGTGYPLGKKKEEVSLPGRILILVEVFDALSHARPYKAAWSQTRIRDFFREQSGRHFDPNLVPKFDELLETQFDRLVHPFDRE